MLSIVSGQSAFVLQQLDTLVCDRSIRERFGFLHSIRVAFCGECILRQAFGQRGSETIALSTRPTAIADSYLCISISQFDA